MKKRLDESAVRSIYRTLCERFGEPIGNTIDVGPGVPDERGGKLQKGVDPDNYGWGSTLKETALTCQQCGGMLSMDETVCQACGMMPESVGGGRHPGHAKSCTCPDCSRPVNP